LILLTGFLGAGKTTLLNALLRTTKRKLGVVVNEFGEVGIDGALLPADARQVELPGGCVCCVLGEDLDRTLIDLVDSNPSLDGIVLETTGVAEPLPIAWALERDEVAKRVRLAAVVTLVDATSFLASRPVSAAVDAQVAYADVVLVTKAELVDEIEGVTSAIRTLASQVPLKIGNTASHATWLDQLLVDPEVESHSKPHVHDENCRHLDNPSVHGIDSVWISVAGGVDLEELEDALGDLPGNYVRIKGIVQATDGRWHAVHRVGLRVSSEPIDPPDFKEGRIVALGLTVDRQALVDVVSRAR
jgi:G3E family GTPase